MEKSPLLRNEVCRPFCTYYRPGKKEELSCRGFAVLERLMHRGQIGIPFFRSESDSSSLEPIVRNLCERCDFHEDGCDFYHDRSATPCGGFIVLARLVARQTITLSDLDSE